MHLRLSSVLAPSSRTSVVPQRRRSHHRPSFSRPFIVAGKLAQLATRSQIVEDHFALEDSATHLVHTAYRDAADRARADRSRTSAVVSRDLLAEILTQPTSFREGIIESALAKCAHLSADEREDCLLQACFANLGSNYAEVVEGRISLEVAPEAAHDTHASVADAMQLSRLMNEVGVSPSRLLFKLPATWEGIQAVRILEAEGLQCHVADVYCFAQAAAALQAKASVVNVCVGRVRDWATTHQGDSDVSPSGDPGIELARKVHAYAKMRGGGKSHILASGVRRAQDALALAGLDILVLPPKVIAQLESAPEDAGAVAYGPGLSPAEVASAHFSDEELAPVTRSSLEKALALGPAGELLAASIANKVKAGDRVRDTLSHLSSVNM